MNDNPKPAPAPPPTNDGDSERTKQVTVAGWTAGVSAFFALGALTMDSSWPVTLGVAAVAAMVAVVCYFILRGA